MMEPVSDTLKWRFFAQQAENNKTITLPLQLLLVVAAVTLLTVPQCLTPELTMCYTWYSMEGGRLYLEYMEKPCVDLISSVLSPVLVMYVDLKKVLCFYPQPPRRVCEKTGEWSKAWVAESELDPDPISFCNWAATIKVPFRCSFFSFNFAFRSTHIFDWCIFFSLSS